MFENLKILDLSTVLAGPSVATFFAELGADVIKIEDINHRDVTRSWRLEKEKKDSVSAYFSSVNYRKKHLVLDFTDRKDLRTIEEFVKKSDIVISDFLDCMINFIKLKMFNNRLDIIFHTKI